MTDRNLRTEFRSPDRRLTLITGKIVITGSTGATTSDTLTYASASCKSNGQYRVTLEDLYTSLKFAGFTFECTGSQNLVPRMSGSAVSGVFSGSQNVRVTDPYIDFTLVTGSSGVAAKPQEASTSVYVQFWLQDKS